MSIAASSALLSMMLSQKFDLQFKLNSLLGHRMYLSGSASKLVAAQGNYEPGSTTHKYIQQKIKAYNDAEAALSARIENIKSELQMTESAVRALKQQRDKNIQAAFS